MSSTYLLGSPLRRHPTRLADTIGAPYQVLEIESEALRRLDRRGRGLESAFRHTPDPLIRSWRTSRRLMAKTKPGDVVITSDRDGLAGIFAITQWSLPSEERRQVWTLGFDSRFLEMRIVAGTHEMELMPLASVIDWEITQYRYSDRVIAFSRRAFDELARIGVEAEISSTDQPTAMRGPTSPAGTWWVPGPVSRRNQTGEILRAVTSVPEATAVVGDADEADEIWDGSAWDALNHSRSVLGDRLRRSDLPPPTPDVIVIGEVLEPPDERVMASVASGVPVVVPRDSAAALLWPEAAVWDTADDLVGMTGAARPTRPQPEPPPTKRTSSVESRAERVSVCVPVFRDVEFLDECVESILGQETAPVEVILIDDGSGLDSVTSSLEEWARRDDRIRLIEGDHRGVCVARNTAMEAMTGDCFLFIDSDDHLEPSFLTRCTTMLRSRDDLWGVATWTRFFGTYEGVEAKPPFDRRVGLRENPIISTAVLMDIAVRDRGIRFLPDLAFLYCEDWNVWSQITAGGGVLGLVPEVLVNHRVHQASGGHLRTELAHAVGKARATAPLRG